MNNPTPESRISAAAPAVASTLDLLAIVWRRRYVVAACCAVALMGGVAAYFTIPDTYETKTAVLLVEKNPQPVTNDPRWESGFEAFLATHRALIVSPLIVERAIESGDLRALSMFRDLPETEELSEYIISHLEAGNAGRELGENADRIMTLTFHGGDADECPVVVDAILTSYQSFLDEAYRGMSDDVLKLIEQARDLLENKLKEQEQRYIQFRQQSPLVSRGPEEINPLQDRLTAIDTQRSELMIRQAQLEAQLAAIQRAMDEGYSGTRLVALIADMRRQTLGDQTFVSTANGVDSQIIQLLNREQQLLEQFGKKHPHVESVRKRIVQLQKLQALPTTAHLTDMVDDEATEVSPELAYVEFLKKEIERLDTANRRLQELYEQEHEVAKSLAAFQLQDEQFERDMTRTQQLYDEVISQLQEASLVKGIGGYEAHIIAPPREGKKIGPSIKILGAGSLLIGLIVGCAAAVVMELRSKWSDLPSSAT